jgi:hypothetical protein
MLPYGWAVPWVKKSAALFTLGKKYGIIQLIGKLEFDEEAVL